MSSAPDGEKLSGAAHESAPDSLESPERNDGAIPGKGPSLDELMSGLTALQLGRYGQVIGAASAPTHINPVAADLISIRTAACFGAHAQVFEAVSRQFAAEHQALLERLASLGDVAEEANPGAPAGA
ncbi:PE family protein [Mycobacterium sp. THU-M104]|uniref:PE family protein n=1 Tax=Mycobacterium sp. THU-M104 TaxID=3410515 RepID=UPI003B9AA628